MSAPPATTPAVTPLRTWLRLLACSTLVEREVRTRLRDAFDTTLPRFDLLAQLDAAARDAEGVTDGALTMSELAGRLMVTNGNLTGLVERLVREGLVTRTPHPADRRTQVVRLTHAGRDALHRMTPEHHRWIDELFAGLAPHELDQLHDLLGRLRGTMPHAGRGSSRALPSDSPDEASLS